MPVEHEVTGLLQRWSDGDKEALDRLVPLVYDELRRAARRYMRDENNNHTLQTTALVNEVYLRLVDQKQTRWQNRAHFFGIAAGMMRRILVDHARRRKYQKRGGDAAFVQLSLREAEAFAREEDLDLLKLDEALTELAKLDPRRSRVVELRFFAGLDMKETAEALHVSIATVLRDWNMAKAWLYRYMKDER
ncbi:MAG: sigma-70 family RNA polymerase sigma factor [Pyrinomonadaceae bacterium]|nr:sigma-70 family RNA polymerase sigma factor [Pyrinomonadaceae bacterium]